MSALIAENISDIVSVLLAPWSSLGNLKTALDVLSRHSDEKA